MSKPKPEYLNVSITVNRANGTRALNKATPKTEFLRTTVLRSIVNQFGLTEYDKLEWILKVEGGEIIIQVKPLKGEVR